MRKNKQANEAKIVVSSNVINLQIIKLRELNTLEKKDISSTKISEDIQALNESLKILGKEEVIDIRLADNIDNIIEYLLQKQKEVLAELEQRQESLQLAKQNITKEPALSTDQERFIKDLKQILKKTQHEMLIRYDITIIDRPNLTSYYNISSFDNILKATDLIKSEINDCQSQPEIIQNLVKETFQQEFRYKLRNLDQGYFADGGFDTIGRMSENPGNLYGKANKQIRQNFSEIAKEYNLSDSAKAEALYKHALWLIDPLQMEENLEPNFNNLAKIFNTDNDKYERIRSYIEEATNLGFLPAKETNNKLSEFVVAILSEDNVKLESFTNFSEQNNNYYVVISNRLAVAKELVSNLQQDYQKRGEYDDKELMRYNASLKYSSYNDADVKFARSNYILRETIDLIRNRIATSDIDEKLLSEYKLVKQQMIENQLKLRDLSIFLSEGPQILGYSQNTLLGEEYAKSAISELIKDDDLVQITDLDLKEIYSNHAKWLSEQNSIKPGDTRFNTAYKEASQLAGIAEVNEGRSTLNNLSNTSISAISLAIGGIVSYLTTPTIGVAAGGVTFAALQYIKPKNEAVSSNQDKEKSKSIDLMQSQTRADFVERLNKEKPSKSAIEPMF